MQGVSEGWWQRWLPWTTSLKRVFHLQVELPEVSTPTDMAGVYKRSSCFNVNRIPRTYKPFARAFLVTDILFCWASAKDMETVYNHALENSFG
jgi:hypothetical protein